jgi:hypothetical protein
MLKKIFAIILLSLSQVVCAEEKLANLAISNEEYAGPSVATQVALMDKDNNGFADVFEVRAYLELIHGKGYEKPLLDKWAISATAKSCSTSIVKELYSEKPN